MSKPLTNEQFIEKAKLIHGDKYDYALINYKNAYIKIKIICPKHGIFEQRPHDHLSGCGCPLCANEKRNDYKKLDTKSFIEKARLLHDNKYDYSKTEYKEYKSKVIITCPEHGDFLQTPDNHLQGQGCPICRYIKAAKSRKNTTEEFIRKAKQIHGDKYDYSRVEYDIAINKIKIICPKHGEFLQTPNAHLNGQGCPFCAESKGERQIRVYLEGLNLKYQANSFICYADGKKGYVDFKLLCGMIEFDGEQHFHSKEYFGGTNEYQQIMKRDEKKNAYCKENDIPLLRIRYDQIDDIEEIINHFLANPDFYKHRCNPYLTNEEYYSIREAA